jgi:hypothetical protein
LLRLAIGSFCFRPSSWQRPNFSKNFGRLSAAICPRTPEIEWKKRRDTKVVSWDRMAHIGFGIAQRKAQKLAYKQRQTVLKADTWLEESLSFAGTPMV